MKECHIVEFIGKPKEVISKMDEAFIGLSEIRVTVRYEVVDSSVASKDSKAAKHMLEIRKTIKVNKRLKKNDSAIIRSIIERFGIEPPIAESLVKGYSE